MQEHLIETYHELMVELRDLPLEIHHIQKQVADYQFTLAEVERMLVSAEARLISQAEGKNAEQRKAALELLKTEDRAYVSTADTLHKDQERLTNAKNDLDHLQRVYGAVCYQTRLHAAMLTYLGSAGAPVTVKGDVDFSMKMTTKHTNNNTVSAADAAAIGL